MTNFSRVSVATGPCFAAAGSLGRLSVLALT